VVFGLLSIGYDVFISIKAVTSRIKQYGAKEQIFRSQIGVFSTNERYYCFGFWNERMITKK